MSVIDVLLSDPTDVVTLNFTATSGAGDDVAVSAVGANMIFRNAAGQSFFVLGDTLKLLRAWAILPFGFGPGRVRLSNFVRIGKGSGAAGLPTGLPELASLGYLTFPQMCDPVEMEGLVIAPVTGVIGTNLRWKLALMEAAFLVSMVNLPARLEGDSFTLVIALEVEHTKAMQTLEGP